jgi:hypothetical protein
MKQTAVEFLIEEIECRGLITKELRLCFTQAKEMEKEQIKFAYNDGAMGAFEKTYKGMHDYYNENYGGKNA